MPDYVDKQLTSLQKQIENLIKPEIMTVAEIVDLFILGLPHNGRLTLTSGTAVLTSDVTAAATVYFTPYLGNRISLYDGSDWTGFSFSELSIAVPSTIYRLFDIFVYSNAGVLTLETVNWNQSTAAIAAASNATPIVITSNGHGLSNTDMVAIAGVGGNTAANGVWAVANVAANTFELEGSAGSGAYTAGGTWYKLNATRATAITLQNGRYVKSGETNKLYLGTAMTTGTSGQTEVTLTNVLLQNYYNSVYKSITLSDSNLHTYTSATIRPWRGINSNKVGFLQGVVETPAIVALQADFNFDTGDGAVNTAISVNRTSGVAQFVTTVRDVMDARGLSDTGTVGGNTGYNFLQLTQTGAATSPDFRQVFLKGVVPQ